MSVSDASGETLEYVMAPEVTAAPPPKPANNPQDDSKNDNSQIDDFSGNGSVSGDDENGGLTDFTGSGEDILMKDFKPQKLLAIIKDTDDFYLKSRYINSALASQNARPLASESEEGAKGYRE